MQVGAKGIVEEVLQLLGFGAGETEAKNEPLTSNTFFPADAQEAGAPA